MNACLSQSTSVSERRTATSGYERRLLIKGVKENLRIHRTYIRYGPKHVTPSEPSETLWEREASGEVEFRSTEFNEVAKRDDKEH